MVQYNNQHFLYSNKYILSYMQYQIEHWLPLADPSVSNNSTVMLVDDGLLSNNSSCTNMLPSVALYNDWLKKIVAATQR